MGCWAWKKSVLEKPKWQLPARRGLQAIFAPQAASGGQQAKERQQVLIPFLYQTAHIVIPVQAGIQGKHPGFGQALLDPRLRGDDGIIEPLKWNWNYLWA